MKIKTLYQTLKDKGNPDYIEQNAPFKCNWGNAWLGEGYYFWDTFIENAHWWGKVRHGQSYIICKAECDFSTELCFDLVGDTEHMLDFDESIKLMKSKKIINKNTTVSRIINFLREKVPHFTFQAIRVYGIKSISDHNEEYKKYKHRLIFEISKPQYLDYKPAIQICLFKKNSLNIRNFKIEFPDEYNPDFII